MKIVNFELLELEKVDRCKNITIKLSLNDKLDMRYSEFTKLLYEDISNQIDSSDMAGYPGAIIFQIYMDLERADLKDLRDLVMSGVVKKLVITKDKIKHEERRLGVPKALGNLDIMQGHIMDLINYPLMKESFDVEFYDFKNRLYKPLVSRKV